MGLKQRTPPPPDIKRTWETVTWTQDWTRDPARSQCPSFCFLNFFVNHIWVIAGVLSRVATTILVFQVFYKSIIPSKWGDIHSLTPQKKMCKSVFHWLNASGHESCWQIDAVLSPVSARITTSTVSVWVLFLFMSSALFLSQIPLQTLSRAQIQTWVLSCFYLRLCFVFYCLRSLAWVNSILLISCFPKSSSCFGPTANLLWISDYDS